MEKKVLVVAILVTIALLIAATPAFADGPGNSNPSPSGANHGAFNAHNSVYGEPGVRGNGDSMNSSGFGTAGGSGSNAGPVGQEPGATGYNNSSSAPWGAQNP